MPPPEPGPFEGTENLDNGSPYWGRFTFGSVTSGGATIVGSIISLGFGLLTTAIGGVNCLSDGFGNRPLLAGRGERSPPPPPPPPGFLAVGIYSAISGAISEVNA